MTVISFRAMLRLSSAVFGVSSGSYEFDQSLFGKEFWVRTFGELPSVELTGFELYCDDVAEGLVEELYWDS